MKILQMPMLKITEFLERLYIDLEKLLLVIFLGFWYFLSIKDNDWKVFIRLLMKTKKKIYNKLVNFQIQIENLLNQKIQYIYSKWEFRNNVFNK